MAYIKAIYLDGKVITGKTHGEAYGLLTDEEKKNADDIISGFIDSKTNRFFDVDSGIEFYTKKFLFVRHGSVKDNQKEPDLSQEGIFEVEKVASYLRAYNLKGCQAIVSPSLRCIRTAQIIADSTRITFEVEPSIQDKHPDEPNYDYYSRLRDAIASLSIKSLIISHCPTIIAMLNVALGETSTNNIPTGSITVVDHKRALCLGFRY